MGSWWWSLRGRALTYTNSIMSWLGREIYCLQAISPAIYKRRGPLLDFFLGVSFARVEGGTDLGSREAAIAFIVIGMNGGIVRDPRGYDLPTPPLEDDDDLQERLERASGLSLVKVVAMMLQHHQERMERWVRQTFAEAIDKKIMGGKLTIRALVENSALHGLDLLCARPGCSMLSYRRRTTADDDDDDDESVSSENLWAALHRD